MKRIALFIITLFVCVVCYGATFNQYWYIEDNTPIQTSCTTGGDIILPTPPTKYGYDFIGWEQLPLTRIEYLESTGTQYITLDIGENGQSKILEAEMEYTTFLTYSISVANTDNNSMTSLQIETSYNNVWSAYTFSSLSLTSIQAQTYTKYKIKIHYESRNTKFYVDNNLILSSSGGGTVGKKFTFFANYSTNSKRYGNFSAVKIYNVKISDLDGNILAELIPVIDPFGTPCLFDKVEQKFYYNAGTGDFIAGPVIGE